MRSRADYASGHWHARREQTNRLCHFTHPKTPPSPSPTTVLQSGRDKLTVSIAETHWLLKAYKGPFTNVVPESDKDGDLGVWAEVVETFKALIETSLQYFPVIAKRDEDALVRMLIHRG